MSEAPKGEGTPKPLAFEIHEIVKRAAALAVQCTSDLIYGSLTREITSNALATELSALVRAQHVVKTRPVEGDTRICFYAPGPVPLPNRRKYQPWACATMGFMARARLIDARARARKVWRDAESGPGISR